VVEHGTNVTHEPELIVDPFLTFQHITMNIGDHGVGVCDTIVDVGDHCMDVYNAVVDVGSDHMGIHGELSLKVGG